MNVSDVMTPDVVSVSPDASVAAAAQLMLQKQISDVMTHEVQTVPSVTPLQEAVRLMERRNIKRVLVVDNDKVVGIVTRANLLHAVAGFAHEIPALSAQDAAIRERLLAEF